MYFRSFRKELISHVLDEFMFLSILVSSNQPTEKSFATFRVLNHCNYKNYEAGFDMISRCVEKRPSYARFQNNCINNDRMRKL